MAREMKHAKHSVTPEARAERRAAQRARKNRKIKVRKPFRVFMLLWILVLVILGVVAVGHVRGILREMQANTPSQFVEDRLSSLKDEQIKSLFDFNTQVDEGDQVANVKKFFKDKSYTVKQVKGTDDYSIYNGERKILTVSLKKVKSVSKLAIFNYNIYELAGITPSEEKELYHCEVTAPSSCTVSLGGKELTPTSTQPLANFADASKFVELPSENSYILDHLTKPAELRIQQDGKDVAFTMSENIVVDQGYEKFASLAEAGCDFDAIQFAENWSRFMTQDLGGSRYGFYTIAESLIKDTQMYEKAWKWATNIDITFVSSHTLKKPPFSEQSATNVVRYSPDALSVDIHLVKHMVISGTGNHDDVMDSTFYLIKHEGKWKVMNIRGKVADGSASAL